MTLTDELKILDDKIRANQVEYDLDREAAKISAFSTKELDQYEYLIGEDVGYKPGLIAKAKLEYSSLGEAFNKVSKTNDLVSQDKYDNDLVYDSRHNFNKCRLSNFNEISSVDSKCDIVNTFYKDFKKLVAVKSKKRKKKKSK